MKVKTFLALAGVAAGIAVIHAAMTTRASSIQRGDVNGDGVVDAADVTRLQAYFGIAVNPDNPEMVRADLNGDGFIDIADYSILVALIRG